MNKEIKRLGGVGILNEDDIKDFSKAEKLLIENLEEGVWYPVAHIVQVLGQREALRRLRDLRKKGYVVDKQRISIFREFYYRIQKKD
jgi:hypothetical protein